MTDSVIYNDLLEAFYQFPFCKKGVEYAIQVVADSLPQVGSGIQRHPSKYERLSCQRFIDDLTGQTAASKKYKFDPSKGERICKFAAQMPHVKGRWAAKKQKLEPEPWQVFFLMNLFGWVDDNGHRRFRTVYLKVPRKNGKSFLAATIGNFMLTADDEYAAEVYCGATSEKQAWEVFGPARQMALNSPEFCAHFGVKVMARSLIVLDTNSKFEPVIGKPGDGSNPHCAIADEFHEHDTDDFVATMITGMGAREQPILLQITTAGSNISSPCYDLEVEAKAVLDGVFDDDRFLILIYGIDESDDWTTKEALAKANPNIGISVSEEFLLDQQAGAVRSAAKQNAFKRKHLNVWVGAHSSWMNLEALKRCKGAINAAAVDGMACVIPIDLASRIDITAVLRVYYEVHGSGDIHYKLTGRFYLPEETIFDERNTHYQRWYNDGFIIATEGNELDFSVIRDDVLRDLADFDVTEITYDPWRATQLAQEFQSEGATIVEFRNTVANMSPAMYELEAAIYSGRFQYDGNPVFEWMMGNVVARIDAKDNIYPRKQKPESKIDGAVAAIMAVGRIMELSGPADQNCSEAGIFFL